MPQKPAYTGELTCAMNVRDRKAATRWYQEMLGFELLYDAAEIGWCELVSPVQRVNVGFSEVEKPEVRGGATLVFSVQDAEIARGLLEPRGVRFDGPTLTIEGLVKLATFYDPDGHKLMFSQSLAK